MHFVFNPGGKISIGFLERFAITVADEYGIVFVFEQRRFGVFVLNVRQWLPEPGDTLFERIPEPGLDGSGQTDQDDG
jgi:hypothetical protein